MVFFLFAAVFAFAAFFGREIFFSFKKAGKETYPEKELIKKLSSLSFSVFRKNLIFPLFCFPAFAFGLYFFNRLALFPFSGFLSVFKYFSIGFFSFLAVSFVIFLKPMVFLKSSYPVSRAGKDVFGFLIKSSLFVSSLVFILPPLFIYLTLLESGGFDPETLRSFSSYSQFTAFGALLAAFSLFSGSGVYSIYFLKRSVPEEEFVLKSLKRFSLNSVCALSAFFIVFPVFFNSFIVSVYDFFVIKLVFYSITAGALSMFAAFYFLARKKKIVQAPDFFYRLTEAAVLIYSVLIFLFSWEFAGKNLWLFIAILCGAFSFYLLVFIRSYYSGKFRTSSGIGFFSDGSYFLRTSGFLGESSASFLFIFLLFIFSSYYCGLKANQALFPELISGFSGISAGFLGFLSVSGPAFICSFFFSDYETLSNFYRLLPGEFPESLSSLKPLSEEARVYATGFLSAFMIISSFVVLAASLFYFKFLSGYQGEFRYEFNAGYISGIILSAAFAISLTSFFLTMVYFMEKKGLLASRFPFLRNRFCVSSALILYPPSAFALLSFVLGYTSGFSPQAVFGIFFILSVLNSSLAVFIRNLTDLLKTGNNSGVNPKIYDYAGFYEGYLFYSALFFGFLTAVSVPLFI